MYWTIHCLLSNTLCLHKKHEARTLLFHKAHALSFLNEPVTTTLPFLWFIPCIHFLFCQIVLPADYLTWLSDPCFFRMQKLLLYHKLKWLPRLFLTLSVLHQNLQMALFNFFHCGRMTVLIMVCWAVKSPAVRAAPNTYLSTYTCTGKQGTARPASSLSRLRRQTSVPNPRQRANKIWPILQQFSKDS